LKIQAQASFSEVHGRRGGVAMRPHLHRKFSTVFGRLIGPARIRAVNLVNPQQ
jgi:hypothetical protein